MRVLRSITCVALTAPSCHGFSMPNTREDVGRRYVESKVRSGDCNDSLSRREMVSSTMPTIWAALVFSLGGNRNCAQQASDFTPGGTLVDREVGITVGNAEASHSRKFDNSNVLFYQDYFFKFGSAAPWLEPDSTDFPKTMPFTRIQQRYDALKKYKPRILAGLDRIKTLATTDDVADPTAADVYALRPMGLLANAMLASENSGATNELFLARWYVNEIYLLVSDIRNASSTEEGKAFVSAAKKATNSYLTMMNRVITPKVGEKFIYI